MKTETLLQIIERAESLRTENPEKALALVTGVWEQYVNSNEFNHTVQMKAPRLLFSLLMKEGSGGLQKAIDFAEKNLALPEVLNSPLLQAEMIYLKSKALRYKGELLLALPLAQQALEIFDQLNFKEGNYFEIVGGLSYNLLLLQKYEEAFVYNRKHAEAAKEKKDVHQQAIAMYYFASLHQRIGNLHDSCIQFIQTVRFVKQNHSNPDSFTSTYADIAIVLNMLGKFKTAERFFAKALEIYTQQGDESNTVWAVFQYCTNLHEQKKFDSLYTLLQQNEELLSRYNYGGNKYQWANYKTVVLLHQENTAGAAANIPLLIEALTQPLQGYDTGNILGTLAWYYESTVDYPNALKYYKLLSENAMQVFNSEKSSRLRSMQIQQNIAGAKREKEQAEKLAQLKQEFLANMSHEIRSPMNAVIALSSLLAEEQMPEAQKKKVNIIKRSSENLLGIINDVLDHAKIEAGKFTIEAVPFALSELVSDVENMLALKAAEKKIELKIEIEKNVPDFVTGDPTRLRQVLLNLLNNAVKFTKAGHVKLSVQKPKTKTEEICFEVSDTGIGIAQEQIEKIFSGYTQASLDTARNFGGTGLGLKISKELIQLMGGNLKVTSETGKGTVFSFALPLKLTKGILKPETSGEFIYRGTKQFRFLVADDLPDNRFVIKELLKKCFGPAIIEETENGRLALELALKNNFDLIVMDIDMPEMNGIESAVQIRAAKPQQLILGSSANVMLSIGDLKNFGFTDFLLKPFTKNKFEEKMRNLFKEEQALA